MDQKFNIIIGQGIGPANFGMTEDEIIELFGKPDETDDDKDSHTKTYFYDNILCDFVFEQNPETNTYTLVSALTTNPDYAIDNKIHLGDSEQDLIKYTKTLKAEPPEIETDESTHERYLYFDDLNMIAIFDNVGLATVQIGIWDEDEESEN